MATVFDLGSLRGNITSAYLLVRTLPDFGSQRIILQKSRLR